MQFRWMPSLLRFFVSAQFAARWEPDQSRKQEASAVVIRKRCALFPGSRNDSFCALQQLFLSAYHSFARDVRDVRRAELEKEAQNKPIKWIVRWVFSLISFKMPFWVSLVFPFAFSVTFWEYLFGSCFPSIRFNFSLDIKTSECGKMCLKSLCSISRSIGNDESNPLTLRPLKRSHVWTLVSHLRWCYELTTVEMRLSFSETMRNQIMLRRSQMWCWISNKILKYHCVKVISNPH